MDEMLAILSPLFQMAPEAIGWAFVVFLRIGAMMAVLPGFGEAMVPQRIRLGFALALVAVVLPAVQPGLPPLASISLPLIAQEVIIGLALGLALRLLVMALQTAGAIIAQATALSQMFGVTIGEPQPAIGNLLGLAAVTLAIALGLHVKLAQALVQSYQAFPAGSGLMTALALAQWGSAQVRDSFALAFSLAAPFTIGALLINLALGAVNRAMPMLAVTTIAGPAQIWLGLAALAILVPVILGAWLMAFDAVLAAPFMVRP